MGNLWEKRQQKLAKRQQPKAPSVPPAAGLVEPPARSVPPAPAEPAAAPAPVAGQEPVSVPEPEPAPAPAVVAPAKKPPSLPPLPAAPAAPVADSGPVSVPEPTPVPAPKPPALPPASPAPTVSVPEGSGSLPIEIGSGEVIGSGDVVAESSLPPEASAPDSSLSSLLPPEAAPAPAVSSAPASLPPQVQAAPVVAEAKRKETGMLGFKNPGDNGFLRSGYKLMYAGAAGATACIFTLIGKETHPVTLDLNETKTVSVEAKGGKVSITLTYKGATEDGTKQVEFAVEGGVAAVSGVMERFRRVGPILRSAGRKFLQHLPEVITVGFAAGLAVCGFTLDWVRQELGRLHPYVTLAVPLVMTAIAAWAGAEREKHIKKEMEGSD